MGSRKQRLPRQDHGGRGSSRVSASTHLAVLALGDWFLAYNACWPDPLRVNEGVVRLLDFLRSNPSSPLPWSRSRADPIAKLARHHLIFRSPDNDEALLEQQQAAWLERASQGILLRTLILNVDTRCNMRCSYCNVRKAQILRPREPRAAMSFFTAKAAIDGFARLLDRAGSPSGRVVLFGGEPLLNWEVVRQVSEYVAAHPFRVHLALSVNTNGTLLDAIRARFFRRRGVHVAISLDGLACVHDRYRRGPFGEPTFARTLQAVETACAVGCSVVILTTLHPESFGQLAEFSRLLSRLGVKRWSLKLPTFCDQGAPIFNSPAIPDWAKAFVSTVREAEREGMHVSGLPQPKFAGCDGIGGMVSVEPDGALYPCPGGIRVRLGDIGMLTELPQSEAYLRVAERTLAVISECRACPIGGYCAGACRADAEYHVGTLDGVNREVCGFMKELVRAHLLAAEGLP